MRKSNVLFINMPQKQEVSLLAEELNLYMYLDELNQLAINGCKIVIRIIPVTKRFIIRLVRHMLVSREIIQLL
ncbi:hypothetical protein BK726_27815 [Bacillus thuringiensis serovar londrina]|uniref:Uncharacterized protein n=1 Tax=Bacillus thuringiensis TaxID=1428 RepID=A0AAW4I0Y0_BACTU|nr:hypothetical protein [Bacillus thuringiensis]MBN9901680.1 hypothetical protein [Bacillus thuringiensis]OTX80727.1 hypothetical protein BK726_27815 [Bacillus thuringiensis serovar londrina]